MHGAAKSRISNLEPGAELVRQGDSGQDIYLVLDGVIRVERDGERLAEYGPGAMLGERAHLPVRRPWLDPAPGAEFVRYGGHTEPFAGTIILTHLHWDHVHGLPFFAAGDRPDARVALLLPEQEQAGKQGSAGAEGVLAEGMSPPHFPITPRGPRHHEPGARAPPGRK
jgi:Cyclic nucleotide-binding domain/Metallo-beta-lactamase superfamily